jgi:hypothetical protein
MGANSYPWGPHGPQSGPNEVTPNPTPAYVPPAHDAGAYDAYNAGSYAPPATYSGGTRASTGGGYAPTTYTPRPKSHVVAMILSFLFGPFGLFYASKKGALVMLLLLFGVPVALAMQGAWGPAFHRHPLEILGHDAVMNRMWSVAVFFSVVWSVIGVRSYNKKLQAGS